MPKCKICEQPFEKLYNSFQKTCPQTSCMVEWGKKQQEKQYKQRTRELRKKVREKDHGWHVQTLQKEFNKWIRFRDKDKPCIACGRFDPPYHPNKGQWDAGHFRSTGAHPELRFVEINCHKECVYCNTNDTEHLIKYQDSLVKLYGQETVDELKGPHKPKHYTIPELQEMTRDYRQRLKC